MCQCESRPIHSSPVAPSVAAGNDISQGFEFNCIKPDSLLAALKSSDQFCQDGSNCHGPRDTFRELVKSGSGLHVCVVQAASRMSHRHDIHPLPH